MQRHKLRPIRLGFALVVALAALPARALEPQASATPLVDGAWLEQRLGAENLVVLDVRNQLGGGSRAAYEQAHIPGAIHSDYMKDGWRTKVDGIVGMLPPLAALEGLVSALGIRNDDHVVIVPGGVSALDYGSATRVYWTFKVLGHRAVSILDGGHALWVKEGRAVEAGAVTRTPSAFRVRFQPELVATREDVAKTVRGETDGELVDNRPQAQFMGKAKHPKAARFGAMPTAVNLPQGRFFDASSGRFTSIERLSELWSQTGSDDAVEQITYCNTGHWASLGWFASSELLGRKSRLYDGSMVEWSTIQELPMVRTE